ncbi:MAG TPA: LPS assembly protein LptD [Terracidiphilus sp.]|nr:LPS assembly protein LptD [Terracidiphilus sp.]
MNRARICYAGLGPRMHPRNLVFITVITLCHLQLAGQMLTNALPPAQNPAGGVTSGQATPASQLPDDPGQEAIPIAKPEPQPSTGVPLRWDAGLQTYSRDGGTVTLSDGVVVYYRDYIIRADKIVYHRATSELEAEGNLQVTGGPSDAYITASHGDICLDMHTARFYDVSGSLGVRRAGRTAVYSTTNPFLFSGRVLLQTGEGSYKIVDGTMTNCRLPKPDWQLIAHSITVANNEATTRNTVFKFLGIPLFYLPYLRHPVEETGRESGLMIPVIENSSTRGLVLGEQVYVVLNRSMDMLVGTEYFSKRGWAPKGDFRYKGPGLDHFTVTWNALFDRGIIIPPSTELVNQGGADIVAVGRYDLTQETRATVNAEYLSSYIYKLAFDDNYLQAVNSEVHSTMSLTHSHNGLVPSAYLERLQNFASSSQGDEVRILHLPSLRFDVLDEPLHTSPLYWRMGSSISYLGRSEFGFHVRNMGRFDFYPHLSLPLVGGGWSVVPEVALRETFYTGSQDPDLTGANGGTPTVSHEPLSRGDVEAAVDLRPPALERDFTVGNHVLRHVIEPEFMYRFVGGIGVKARNVPLIDPADIATDTNEVGYALTQRFYARSKNAQPCAAADSETSTPCPAQPREWASWQIAQKYFLNPTFGGAIIQDRRNVFDTTLDLTGIAFLTGARNLSPLVSRLRFEAINNLRIEWDMDYDPKAGRLDANNLFAGYSFGKTTVGLGHSLLNAVDEKGSAASLIQSQQLQPFIEIGKSNAGGFNFAANGGYDFVNRATQYAGVQAVYNWNCCGLSVGYRRFALGSVRDETQYLYSFTLANFGSAGEGLSRSKTIFHDPTLPPAY